PSFTRFGNFEIFAARGEHDVLRRLADYTLRTDFPELGAPGRDTYVAWLAEIARRTARLMVEWLRVGFVHGVMNTDNMSVLGLTIDYGPYGWLDDYDPDWTPNTTDAQVRRYRFGWQPRIAQWNLLRLAHALSPLFADTAPLQAGLDRYVAAFEAAEQATIAAKLGLSACREHDVARMRELHVWMHGAEVDMTLFFRALAEVDMAAAAPDPAPLD